MQNLFPPKNAQKMGPTNLVNMSGCSFWGWEIGPWPGWWNRDCGSWFLQTAHFFSGLYGEPSGEPVPVVHFFSLLKMKGDYLQKKPGPIAKKQRPLSGRESFEGKKIFDPELEEGAWFAAAWMFGALLHDTVARRDLQETEQKRTWFFGHSARSPFSDLVFQQGREM